MKVSSTSRAASRAPSSVRRARTRARSSARRPLGERDRKDPRWRDPVLAHRRDKTLHEHRRLAASGPCRQQHLTVSPRDGLPLLVGQAEPPAVGPRRHRCPLRQIVGYAQPLSAKPHCPAAGRAPSRGWPRRRPRAPARRPARPAPALCRRPPGRWRTPSHGSPGLARARRGVAGRCPPAAGRARRRRSSPSSCSTALHVQSLPAARPRSPISRPGTHASPCSRRRSRWLSGPTSTRSIRPRRRSSSPSSSAPSSLLAVAARRQSRTRAPGTAARGAQRRRRRRRRRRPHGAGSARGLACRRRTRRPPPARERPKSGNCARAQLERDGGAGRPPAARSAPSRAPSPSPPAVHRATSLQRGVRQSAAAARLRLGLQVARTERALHEPPHRAADPGLRARTPTTRAACARREFMLVEQLSAS